MVQGTVKLVATTRDAMPAPSESTSGAAAVAPVLAAGTPMIGLVPGGMGLGIMDMSNMHEPTKITVVDTGVGTRDAGGDVLVNGTTWYYGGGKGLAVINGFTPSAPTVVKKVATGVGTMGGGMGLTMDPARKLLYCAGGEGLTILDITAADEPVVVSEKTQTGVLSFQSGGTVAISSDNKIIFVGGGLGLAVVDVTDPAKPVCLEKINTGIATSAGGLTLELNGTTLLAAGGTGLAVYDVSDPRAPKRTHKIKTGVATDQGGAGVATNPESGLVFVVGGWGGLAVFDPKQDFKRLSKIETGVLDMSQRSSISLWGQYAIIAGPKGLAVFDVADPANPTKICKAITGALCYKSSNNSQAGVAY